MVDATGKFTFTLILQKIWSAKVNYVRGEHSFKNVRLFFLRFWSRIQIVFFFWLKNVSFFGIIPV